MLYPIGVQSFEEIINRKFLYVDKTDLVYNLAQSHICFLSRPRRFGKSLLVSTLDAYFSGRKELFKGLKIDKLEKDWIQYSVFRIDFAGGNYSNPDELTHKLERYLSIWEKQYGKDESNKTISDRFEHILKSAYEKTGHKAVVLIDEYDKSILDVLKTDLEEKNRNILKGFYGTFKAADDYLRFVFVTGVTKYSQSTLFSGFNQPKDISMDYRYDTICGITEKELYSYLEKTIEEMANMYKCSIEEMKNLLKKQYDGYHFSEGMIDIYNPFSIINALDSKNINNSWYQSGTPTYLVKLLEGHNVNMQKLTEQTYASNYFMDYRADSEDPLAMLYQSGYLTIKGYDREYNEYYLDFPNNEVRSGFVTLMASNYFHQSDNSSSNWIKNIDRMFKRCDLDGIKDAFTSFLSSIPYVANKDERAKNLI